MMLYFAKWVVLMAFLHAATVTIECCPVDASTDAATY